MNPQNPTPTVADDLPASDVARRVGPWIAIASLLLATGFLSWLAVAPTAVAGPLEDAPFTVPGTLAVRPDDDGCLRLVAGDGTSREHCLEELAQADDVDRYVELWFDEEQRLIVLVEGPERRQLLHVDTETGEVVDTLEDIEFADRDGDPGPMPQDREAVEVPDHGPPDALGEEYVYADGDRVLRNDDGRWDPAADEVVLDLQGPPGYRIDDATLSPDGAWVVAMTPGGEVVVAPTDGSAEPHVWTDVDDRWIGLHNAIRWDS